MESWLLKRIEITQFEKDNATDQSFKITKGAKLTVYKECLEFTRTHMNIDKKIVELLALGGSLYIESYSHSGKDMYKYNNPFTDYNKDTRVLHPVEDGIEKSLDAAIEDIKKMKLKFYS